MLPNYSDDCLEWMAKGMDGILSTGDVLDV